MIDFIAENKIITYTLIGGFFTTMLITSLRNNLVDPFFEKLIPSHTLHHPDCEKKKIV